MPHSPYFYAYVNHVKYIGSFPVSGTDQSGRADFVRTQLEIMREAKKKKSVLLVISLAGVKACSPDGKNVYMAHALRRISYATCDPEHCQFSFLAREPKGHYSLQYCHSFLTESSQQAEELNTIVGNAFRMAYAAQLQRSLSQQPTTQQHQQHQQQQQQQQQTTAIYHRGVYDDPALVTTPPSSCDNSPLHRSCRQRLESNANNPGSPRTDGRSKNLTGNKLWAKQLLSQSQHVDSILDRVLEMNMLSGLNDGSSSIQRIDMANGNLSNLLLGRRSGSPSVTKPHNLPGLENLRNCDDLLTPSSTSSDEANSPTELNSYKRLVDKPPLVKRLNMTTDSCEEELCPLVKASSRDTSGGYVNEGMGSSTDDFIDEIPVKDVGFTTRFSQVASLPSPPSPESLMDQSSDGSKRSSRSSESQGSFLHESLVIQEKTQCSPFLMRKTDKLIADYQGSPTRLKLGYSKLKENSSPMGVSSCSSSSSPPPLPERYDSLQTNESEEGELRKAPWFQAGIPREIALEILAQEPIGAFMVRESTTKLGCYALSLRVPKEFQPVGIAHYLIMKTNKGFKIKGFMKEFSTLTALITHHSVMPELLPCPLSLSKYNPNFAKHDSNQDFTDIDDDPDYNTLADFRKIMADLNV